MKTFEEEVADRLDALGKAAWDKMTTAVPGTKAMNEKAGGVLYAVFMGAFSDGFLAGTNACRDFIKGLEEAHSRGYRPPNA